MQYGLDLTTVICCTCGFVFTNPLPHRDIYDRFYVEAYADYYGHITAPPIGQVAGREPEYLKQQLDRIEAVQCLAGCRLLEVGPGQGLFLWWAQRRGCEVLGVEPSDQFHTVVTSNGLPCLHGSFADADLPITQLFDIIVMFHVLEHFYDPNAALQICRERLRDDGLLVIEVPNILKPFRSLDRYFLRYVHTSNFSPQTLRLMLSKHGYVCEFVDEGGNEWRAPQSLFVIARKTRHLPPGLAHNCQTAREVRSHLERYRRVWTLWLAAAWYGQLSYQKSRRVVIRIARRMKKLARRT